MKWAKVQAVVLVIALVVAASQCLANCLAKPCHEIAAAQNSASLPPCHKHQTPKPATTQESCKSSVLIADTRASYFAFDDMQRLDVASLLTQQPLAGALSAERLVHPDTTPPISNP